MKIEENKQNALNEKLNCIYSLAKKGYIYRHQKVELFTIINYKKDNGKSNKEDNGRALFWWNPPKFTTLPLGFTNYLLDVLPR